MLYVVATPIGNLSDISLRAIEVLRASDYILCEDTRHSYPLLKHYDISKPLKSFHKFSESSKADDIINDLLQGSIVSLISDAGTPGISDPGEKLIHACIRKDIPVISIPGPCAAIAALTVSGLSTERFQFVGFLPRKSGELRRALQDILAYNGTTVCYESPNRLLDVLECLDVLAPKRSIVVARELTKKFEEIKRGTSQSLIDHWKVAPLKGEVVLLISGEQEKETEWQALSPQQHVEYMQLTYGLSRGEAIVAVAKIRGVSKRDVYNEIHRTND